MPFPDWSDVESEEWFAPLSNQKKDEVRRNYIQTANQYGSLAFGDDWDSEQFLAAAPAHVGLRTPGDQTFLDETLRVAGRAIGMAEPFGTLLKDTSANEPLDDVSIQRKLANTFASLKRGVIQLGRGDQLLATLASSALDNLADALERTPTAVGDRPAVEQVAILGGTSVLADVSKLLEKLYTDDTIGAAFTPEDVPGSLRTIANLYDNIAVQVGKKVNRLIEENPGDPEIAEALQQMPLRDKLTTRQFYWTFAGEQAPNVGLTLAATAALGPAGAGVFRFLGAAPTVANRLGFAAATASASSGIAALQDGGGTFQQVYDGLKDSGLPEEERVDMASRGGQLAGLHSAARTFPLAFASAVGTFTAFSRALSTMPEGARSRAIKAVAAAAGVGSEAISGAIEETTSEAGANFIARAFLSDQADLVNLPTVYFGMSLVDEIARDPRLVEVGVMGALMEASGGSFEAMAALPRPQRERAKAIYDDAVSRVRDDIVSTPDEEVDAVLSELTNGEVQRVDAELVGPEEGPQDAPTPQLGQAPPTVSDPVIDLPPAPAPTGPTGAGPLARRPAGELGAAATPPPPPEGVTRLTPEQQTLADLPQREKTPTPQEEAAQFAEAITNMVRQQAAPPDAGVPGQFDGSEVELLEMLSRELGSEVVVRLPSEVRAQLGNDTNLLRDVVGQFQGSAPRRGVETSTPRTRGFQPPEFESEPLPRELQELPLKDLKLRAKKVGVPFRRKSRKQLIQSIVDATRPAEPAGRQVSQVPAPTGEGRGDAQPDRRDMSPGPVTTVPDAVLTKLQDGQPLTEVEQDYVDQAEADAEDGVTEETFPISEDFDREPTPEELDGEESNLGRTASVSNIRRQLDKVKTAEELQEIVDTIPRTKAYAGVLETAREMQEVVGVDFASAQAARARNVKDSLRSIANQTIDRTQPQIIDSPDTRRKELNRLVDNAAAWLTAEVSQRYRSRDQWGKMLVEQFGNGIQKFVNKILDIVTKAPSIREPDTGRLLSGFAQALQDIDNKYIQPVEEVLRKIDPSTWRRVRAVETQTLLRVAEDRKKVRAYLTKFARLDKPTKTALDRALQNGDSETLQAIHAERGMTADYQKVRAVLDQIHQDAESVGLDVSFLEEYWPRNVVDLQRLREDMRGTDQFSLLEEAVEAENAARGGDMTQEEKDSFMNDLLRGYSQDVLGGGATRATEHRVIRELSPEQMRFYQVADGALDNYLTRMHRMIEARKAFGEADAETSELSSALARDQRALERIRRTADERNIDPKKIRLLEQRIDARSQDLDARRAEAGGQADTIGAYVNQAIAEGRVDQRNETSLRNALNAVYGAPKPASEAYMRTVRFLKEWGYVDLLANPRSAITQLKDLGPTLYLVGVQNGGKAFVDSFRRRIGKDGGRVVTVEDVGLESIAEEMAETSRFLNTALKVSGFKDIDTLGKETLLTGVLNKIEKQAKQRTLPADLRERLQNVFADRDTQDQVVRDLRDGNLTEEVRMVLLHDLMDMQPISRIQMPEFYLTNPGGRIWYMLRSHSLRRLAYVRRHIFKELKDNPQEGFKRLAMFSASLLLAGVPADMLKDYITGKETALPDLALSNILDMVGVTRWQFYQIKDGRLANATALSPLSAVGPMTVTEAIRRDLSTWERQKALGGGVFDTYTAERVPFAGPFLRHVFGVTDYRRRNRTDAK
jgi:hypothetical protein